MDLKSKIRSVPDFPKKGILFYDITTMIKDAAAFKETVEKLFALVKDKKYDKVAAIESRGFIFAAPLAVMLGCGFVIIRKPGKLPAKTISQSYSLEYGSSTLEIHKDAITKEEKVLLVDDLLATGGTMACAASLIEELGGKVETLLFVIDLAFLSGREKLKKYEIKSLLSYDK